MAIGEFRKIVIESAVVAKVFQDMFDRLPPDQREQVILEMQGHSDDPSLGGCC